MESRKLRGDFDGGMLGCLGISILQFLLVFFTLGIGAPWATCMGKRWEIRHTTIGGRRLVFDGRGIQLLGNQLKWFFLSIITLGIYAWWLGVKQHRWYIKHIRFEDDPEYLVSTFSGTAAEDCGLAIFTGFFALITLFLAVPALICMRRRWACKNTAIGGKRLAFEGTGGRLFGKYMLWYFLTIITLGIFGLWLTVKEMRWFARNTVMYANECASCEYVNRPAMPAAPNGGMLPPPNYGYGYGYGAPVITSVPGAAYNITIYAPSPYVQPQQQGMYMLPPTQR